jgi:hypothetical protein
MAGKGISGLAVAFASVGGVLAYAGFKGQSPIAALREISSKAGPSAVSSPGVDLGENVATALTGAGVAVGVAAAGAVVGSVGAAAGPYMNDRYSQIRRRETGYSDCSSFVYKILRDMGMPLTVAWSATSNMHVDPRLRTIPTSQAASGDLALSAGHVMILTGGGGANAPAIGQQNTRENVRSGTLASLMPKPYVIKRYVNAGNPALVATGVR